MKLRPVQESPGFIRGEDVKCPLSMSLRPSCAGSGSMVRNGVLLTPSGAC